MAGLSKEKSRVQRSAGPLGPIGRSGIDRASSCAAASLHATPPSTTHRSAIKGDMQ
jgi:hypothetical protein